MLYRCGDSMCELKISNKSSNKRSVRKQDIFDATPFEVKSLNYESEIRYKVLSQNFALNQLQ